ncbi:hypothetical protein EVAR_52242_1 [Eumeta japonica]|uniref:Uncharacterized protein n=1 Tax=Eumeta variegata TaxID=151549 RepID=A0A4C1YVM1_EUMVA|nr:hypothetical protein EVAR_52242_1 [Eumeta japonica]
MGQRVIGPAGQYLQEDLESLKMLTSPSLPFTLRIALAARPSPPERPCRRDRVVASSTIPTVPPLRQGRPTLPRCGYRRATLLDSVEHLRTPSFLVAGAQAHEAYRTIGSITLVSTIEFVFDGANLSLFLTPQQCTRARARLPPPRSTKPTVREHEDHIIRERLHVYAEFPEFYVLDDYLPVPKVASTRPWRFTWQPRARSRSPTPPSNAWRPMTPLV